MDITQLRYFLKTAETLNYSRAAESLFITRQSLRQAIASIEDELGAPLFHNQRNHLSLTECGACLALSGAGVVRSFDDLWSQLTALAAQQVTLTFAFSESLVPLLLPTLPELLQRFQTRFPQIPLNVCRWDTDQVIRAAEAGEIDCGCVLRMPWDHPAYAVRVLKTFPAALDFGADFPLPHHPGEGFSLAALGDLPCIGMGSPQNFMRPLWEDCQAQGIHLNYRVVPNTIDAFYQIQNDLAAGFDILDDRPMSARPIYSIPLPEYSFQLSLLCPRSRPNPGPTELLCRFMAEELENTYPQPS